MFEALVNTVLDFFVWLAAAIANIFITLIPQSVIDFLNSNAFAFITDFIGDVTYFIPIYGIFGIIGTTIGIVAVIRLLRWAIGFVPTIEG